MYVDMYVVQRQSTSAYTSLLAQTIGEPLGGLTWKAKRWYGKNGESPQGAIYFKTMSLGLANWDCEKEGMWLPNNVAGARSVEFSTAQPIPLVRREKKRVGKRQEVVFHVIPARAWGQGAFDEFVTIRDRPPKPRWRSNAAAPLLAIPFLTAKSLQATSQ